MALTLEERLLLSMAASEEARDVGATVRYTLDNCLMFPQRTVPDFASFVQGKTVLDYGCGPGWQAVAMGVRCGAKSVFGLDIRDDWVEHGRALAAEHNAGQVTFGTQVPPELNGTFDVVISISAFEHFADPARELERMSTLVRPGGTVLLTWAEPWYSPNGSHFGSYARIPGTEIPIPWMNLFFSDQALLTLRSRFRTDRPQRLEDVEGGLNRMTIARFERILKESGLEVHELTLFPVKGLAGVTRIPVLRELLTTAVSCKLRVPGGRS